jgi:hypothetical protein
MFRPLLFLLAAASLVALPIADTKAVLHRERSSPGDLEVGGELGGLPDGTARYLRYDDLLRLPQETYTVSDDANFRGPTEISGVSLESLAKLFGQSSDLIVAIRNGRTPGSAGVAVAV